MRRENPWKQGGMNYQALAAFCGLATWATKEMHASSLGFEQQKIGCQRVQEGESQHRCQHDSKGWPARPFLLPCLRLLLLGRRQGEQGERCKAESVRDEVGIGHRPPKGDRIFDEVLPKRQGWREGGEELVRHNHAEEDRNESDRLKHASYHGAVVVVCQFVRHHYRDEMIHGSRNRTGDRLPEVEVGIPHDVKDRQKLRDAVRGSGDGACDEDDLPPARV
mmetsp:Transcript_118077/g.280321  ORF Transcript_118077/g.280321 Transcript_118077/m.280321 type:complete len:221 (-) Transcript_118077:1086-1748(-)